MKRKIRAIIRFVASLKLAVVIIIAIGIISAWGTIVESQYNSDIAKKLVYNSIWMEGTLALLAVVLIAVIVDRYPWKRHHLGFILAHIGIIVLLIGSILTQQYGIDGSLILQVGKDSRHVILPETDLKVYSSMDGERYRLVHESEVDFFLEPPSSQQQYNISLPDKEIEVIKYLPFALPDEKVQRSDAISAGPGVRLQLENKFANTTHWLLASPGPTATLPLGPAEFIFTLHKPKFESAKNRLILYYGQGKKETLKYEIYDKDSKDTPVQKGEVQAGDVIQTPWMDMVARILQYWPRAAKVVEYKPLERPTSVSTSAILVRYGGEEHWVGLNSVLKLFGSDAVYILTYSNRRLDIGFDIFLDRFKMDTYQGTSRAATYESHVTVPGYGETVISMNEPLKYKDFTFYQASFQKDEKGEPVISVLSVNWDPGRFLKYFGSILIVLGTVVLFYFRRLGYYSFGKTKAEKG